LFAGDIKLHHTIFALPWALLAAVLAGRTFPQTPLTAGKLLLILVCMVMARTVAMSANRLLDRRLDARNPRTAKRPLPAGKLSPGFVAILAVLCCLGFITATAGFQILYHNPWPLLLAGPVLAYLWGYPLLKRFTGLCHFYLGAALALAPVCAWVAVTGRIDWPPIVMFAAVATWTAGFDIIYACQDYGSDIACGVFSIPAKLGIAGALWVSRATHLLCAGMLLLLGWIVPEFGAIYFTGAGLAIALLCVEQGLVRAGDLSKVNVAFFTINGIISLVVGTLGIVDIMK
jgi:4-hydroxybenzoate polyprenyltransferase